MAQLAFVAVSLMAGRRIGPEEYPDKVRELLTRSHGDTGTGRCGSSLFVTGSNAHYSSATSRSFPRRTPRSRSRATGRAGARRRPLRGDAGNVPKEPRRRKPRLANMVGCTCLPAPVETPAPAPTVPGRRDRILHLWSTVPPPVIRWATVAMCVVAVAEAVFIGRLLLARSSAAAAADTKTVIQPPRVEVLPIELPSAVTPPVVITTGTVDPKVPEIRSFPAPAAAVRTGAFRVSAPIEIHVLDGERVVGSSVDGPIFAAAGRHEFEFVNSALGFRARQVVDIRRTGHAARRPGANGNLTSTPSPGQGCGLTYVGWRDAAGDLSVVPGEHEILFRHPQLGERREKTIGGRCRTRVR